jgi:hypothetical protein
MVSCQEPSPLKGSKHSLQHYPHDAVLVNVHSFVPIGVEARCCPCHSTAHCRHMKRQSSLLWPLPLQLPSLSPSSLPTPLPSPLPIAITVAVGIAVAVTVDHCHRCLCRIAISHRHHHCPCRRPLLSLSPSAIAVAISVGHHCCHRRRPFRRVVALAWQELHSNNLSKECLPYFILFGQWVAH